MNIVLDADGVLLNWVAGFAAFVEAEHGIRPSAAWENETGFGLPMMYPDLPTEQFRALIGRFAIHSSFSAIPLLEGAREGVAALRALFPTGRLVCVTSCGSEPLTLTARQNNLRDFGFDEVVMLPLSGDKTETLRALAPAIFVDDLLKNIVAAESVGLEAILFGSPISREWTHHRHAQGWPEVVRLARNLAVPADAQAAMPMP